MKQAAGTHSDELNAAGILDWLEQGLMATHGSTQPPQNFLNSLIGW